MSYLSFGFVLWILIIPVPVFGDTVRLHPAKDNTLLQSPTGDLSNGSGPALFVGNNSGMNTRRAVLQFSVLDSIPATATINRVELRLFVSNAPNTIPRTITLHRVLADWGEGASSTGGGGGAPAQPQDATWLHTFYPNAFWDAAGGDFETLIVASTVVSGEGFYSWLDAAMVAVVQMWLDDPASNFGWLLKGEETEAATARRIDSRESNVEDNRPVLIVEFTPSDVPTESSTWGRVKALYVPRR